jgi:hypothetical protein
MCKKCGTLEGVCMGHKMCESCFAPYKAPDPAELLREALTALKHAEKRNADAMAQAKQYNAPSHILEIGANDARIFSSAISKLNAALGEP